jgi:hypothetical protein
MRAIKRASLDSAKPDHEDFKQGRCELDTRADTICAGHNFRPISHTGMTCEVSGFHKSFDSLSNVPVAQVATAYVHPDTNETFILIVNEALYFGSTMDHSLINPNQIRAFGIALSDDPYDKSRPFGIDHEDVFIPFSTQGSTVFFDTFVPSDQDMERCRHIVLTSDMDWDPSTVQLGGNRPYGNELEISEVNRACGPHPLSETDIILSQISTTLNQHDFAERLVASVIIEHKQAFQQRENARDHKQIKAVMTNQRHSSYTPERVSRVFGIGLNKAKTTLAVTTQKGIRHSLNPLNKRYRVDHLDLHRTYLKGQWYIDHMTAKKKSINGNTGAWLYTNGHFTASYPTESRSDVSFTLNTFCDDVGTPKRLKSDRAPELVGRNTPFLKLARKRHIDLTYAEPERVNQIHKVDLEMRELKKRCRSKMIHTNAPKRVWDFALVHTAKLMQFVPRPTLNNRTGYEEVTGTTPDISEFLDFDFWDLVWYWPAKHPSLDANDRKLGRWAGVAHRIGSDMCYWIIPESGVPVTDTTVQHVTRDDLHDPSISTQVEAFNAALTQRLDDSNFDNPDVAHFHLTDETDHLLYTTQVDPAYGDNTPTDEDYGDTMLPDSRPEDDDIDSYDKYIGAEIIIDGDKRATVKRRMTDFDGRPLGTANRNPMLDTRQYEIEYDDGTTDAYFANVIAENLYSQVDDEGRQHLVISEISDHRKNATALSVADGFTISSNGNKVPKKTTQGWELLIEWKDGTSDWIALRDVKDANPVELAEYAVANKIDHEPAFNWWVDWTLKKRNRIINKVKPKYWRTSHKYGIRLPKNMEEALRLDEANGNHFWEDAVKKEMGKVKVAYRTHEAHTPEEVRKRLAPELTGYQEITCHLIFDVKMDFTRKARFVANGAKTEAPASITYSSVVSRDSVKLAFLIAALNDLDILACDIGNAYLNAPCREKIWFKAGRECGADMGKVMIITRALYGLKSSGASWRAMLSKSILEMGFQSSIVDPDVYLRRNNKPEGEPYYELLLVYVDDIMCVSHDPRKVMERIGNTYEIKDGEIGPPKIYLGAGTEPFQLPNGKTAWSMVSKQYVLAAVETVKNLLLEDGRELKPPSAKKAHKGPLPPTYKPELDVSRELGPDKVQRYQQIIGILRWAIELGRVDILHEVSIMSQYQANPREGHLEALYLIVHFLSNNPMKRIVFDPSTPLTNEEDFFGDADWTEFYGDIEEEDPPNMPEPLGHPVQITMFVDANHANNVVTRRSHTGIFIFVQNAMIIPYSKRQNTVESATFGSELVAMRTGKDLIVALRIKIKMFGCPLAGPANVYCDNLGVVKNTSIPESTLSKKHNSINYHVIRSAVASGIMRVAKEDGETNLADALTKLMPYSRKKALLDAIHYDY